MLENNTITLEYESTPEDYKALCNFSVFFKKRFTIIFITIVLIVGIILLVTCAAGLLVLPKWYIALYAGIIALIVLMPILQKIMVNRLLSKDSVSFRDQHTYIIDEQKFCQRGGRSNLNAEFNWKRFYQVYETQPYFFLYINNQQAYVVPKAIMTEEEITFFRQILKKQMGKYFYRRCRGLSQ